MHEQRVPIAEFDSRDLIDVAGEAHVIRHRIDDEEVEPIEERMPRC